MLLIRWWGALVALGITACSGCTRDSASTDGHDAAPDEKPRPSVDAGETADTGVMVDASTGVDAGVNPFVGSWGTLGGAQTCSVRIALDPAKSVPPLTFAACASGRAGCKKLVVDWWTTVPDPGLPHRRVLDFRRGTIARVINGTPYLIYSRIYPDPNESIRDFPIAYLSVLQPIDGAPIFAEGEFLSDQCGSWTTFGDYGIGLVTGGGTPAQLLAWAQWSALTTFASKAVLPSQLGANHVQSVAISAGQLYAETVDGFTVDVFDLAAQTLRVPNTPSPLTASYPIPVPDGALVLDGNSPYHADLLKPDATYAPLITPTSPHQLTWAAVDRSAGNALVWVESDFGGAGYVNPVLWTAPYATQSANVVKRKVAVITDALDGGGADMAVNAGVALTVVDKSKALLTRLSDGMSWSITAEPGDAFLKPVWVDDNEVWISTADLTLAYGQHMSGVLRLQRSSLGAPTVPRGF